MFYIQYLKKFINNLDTIRSVEKYLDKSCMHSNKSIEVVN